jgi:uncharacterized RDD family membrane protein YckC
MTGAVVADVGLTLAEKVAAQTGASEMLLRRGLAMLVDLVFVAAALIALVYGGVYVFGAPAFAPAVYVWLALAVAYFPIAEGLFGSTLGKFAAGVSVIDAAGRPPGLGKAGIRAFLRLVEANPIGAALPAAALVAVTPNRRCFGDIASETYVVRTDALIRTLNDPAPLFD